MTASLKSAPKAVAPQQLSRRPARPTASEAAADKEFMTTLAKGLAVLDAFGPGQPAMTLSQAAAATQVSRATARRILRTLTELGYVAQEGRHFSLTPNILDLGFAYLSTQNWIDQAIPLMKDLSERVHESSSAAILQDSEVVYVARVPASRIMSVAISVGSRLHEELEKGLRSIAVPIVDRRGVAVAALNLSTHSMRTTRNHMRETFLPALRDVASKIAMFVN
jgi:DNA-binding IclR family transcriptional regulator